ncbi:MAG: hypothetical protein WC889_08095, partial [Myxococcota bacterium]
MKQKVFAILLVLCSVMLVWYCDSGGKSPADGGTPSDSGYPPDGGIKPDGGKPDDGGVKPDDGGAKPDGGSGDYDGSVGPDGGKVNLLKFGVFGDSRPAHTNKPGDKEFYDGVSNIIRGMKDKGVQFILGSGDWMFCEPGSDAGNECPGIDISLLLAAEGDGGYGGTIFHIMGNHECHTQDDIQCPNENETVNVQQYMARLKPHHRDHSWFDINVDTSLGAARFIIGSPSAMPYPPNDAGGYDGAFIGPQAEWFKDAGVAGATYTFYLQHQPQDDSNGEEGKCIGAAPLYNYMRASNPNVTAYF